MPRSDAQVTITGIRWIGPSKTELQFSNGKKVEVSKLTTVGWNAKLGDAPILIVNEQRYQNCIPKKEMSAWRKKDFLTARGVK